MNTSYIVVLVTAKNTAEAKKIAQGLLKQKLIACANILPGVQSLFWWEGKIDSANEVLLILKTKKGVFKRLEAAVKKLHSYKTPEIIALPIAAGSSDYLQWITNTLPGSG